MDSPDIADLLDGLEGDARAERAELIEWLLEQGITTGQIRDAYSPLLLASRRVLGDDGTLVSAREICESTGIDLDLLRRIQRAIGLPQSDDPDARIHPAIDGDITSYVVKFMDLGFDEDRIVAVIRVIADGLAKTAEAIRFTALSAMMAAGATELEIAKASEALLRQADPLLGPMIQDMLRLQLRHTMETEAVTAGERAKGLPLPGARPVAVAFADLVGFTRLGEAVPPEELEDLARRLVDLTYDVVVPPVRFIKSIGDAVMLVSPDPVPLLVTMLALVDATEAGEDFLRLRAGVATGMAVSRGGDWFGSPVNLASRITGVARPGSVLVSEAARDAIGDDAGFEWSFAGARRLKGIKDDTKLFRARLPNG
ncbi:adenylate/guanylate cyclase domain-containing protein [Mycolicibacterium fluoranthenivorans]|uniref:Adenylate cyclase n=1 Tax=Mycolicibacterium fluoranthenivorans TaxID=258505 RepID=A0A7X5ZFR8_9MYCO|nr:adenylate/guanylate cyclase domain-containing protein [Mycolicibacterium fluoranthenivorans]NIH98470.1 adenylate cyclase [Mycolicibacterium fluoranthenivorans]